MRSQYRLALPLLAVGLFSFVAEPLFAQAPTRRTIRLAWEQALVDGQPFVPDSVVVIRTLDGGAPADILEVRGVDTVTYETMELTRRHCYTVANIKGMERSAPSNEACVTLAGPPSAPINLRIIP